MKNDFNWTRSAFVFLFATAQLALSCGPAEFKMVNESGRFAQLDDVICETFSSGTLNDPRYGIYGRVHYLLDSQPRYSAVQDYYDLGQDLGKHLYLSELFVPTRLFDAGFTTASGLQLKRSDGVLLQEFFSLHLQAGLTLTDSDAPGNYQLAIISDDGAVMQTSSDAITYSTLIDNDGFHPSRMACATTPVSFSAGGRVAAKIDYYQGPRSEIALVLLWRPWPAPGQVNDPLCGQTGSTLFWDPGIVPSQPQQAYQDLLSRGWRPLQAGNFMLLSGSNQCVR